jgi:hypothetical protein
MHLPIRLAIVCSGLACGAAAHAQETHPDAPPSAEPRVLHIVVEDRGVRIEELRVRGQSQRIVVTPKGGTAPSYEIIPADGSRDLGEGANTSRGAAGKRVWHVLSF